MIRHLMANVVRVEYVPPNHTDTYLIFDSGLSKFDLLGSALGTIKMNHDIYHESVYEEDSPEWVREKIPEVIPFIRAIQSRFEKLIENSPTNLYYDSELDSCVENVILGGYGNEPIPKEAFFLAKEYVDLCINMKPSVELLKWYEQIEVNELLEG